MKTRLLCKQAACRLLAGLLFLFMAAPWVRANNTPTDTWDQIITITQIENAGGGDGTPGNPILIRTADELAYLARQVNAEDGLQLGQHGPIENLYGFRGIYFALAADIDLNGHNWTPIGTAGYNTFKGHFDGDGHVVSGLVVDAEGDTDVYAGLFGYLREATIQNLGIKLGKGGVKATNTSNHSNLGSRAYDIFAGGLAGYSAITIRNCYVEGEGLVEATGLLFAQAGGLVGQTDDGSITHCYTTVSAKSTKLNGSLGHTFTGGIVGRLMGVLSYTYATGVIEAIGRDESAGGIVGSLGAEIYMTNCLALNTEIKGDRSARIAGGGDGVPARPNYAAPQMLINGATPDPADRGIDTKHGADIRSRTFEADLKSNPAGSDNGWAMAWTFTPGYLPQLKKVIENTDGTLRYESWKAGSDGKNRQPWLPISNYLDPVSVVRLVAPTGGTFTVTDPDGVVLTGTELITPGTELTITCTPHDGYEVEGILAGHSEGNLSSVGSNTITVPADANLWLSAAFKALPPPYVPPVYHTVTLPQVEGAGTSPMAGNYEVESWDNFKFYLTLDPAYSDSKPIVTTSRGETIQPRVSDGAYLVKYVRDDIVISISGILPNNPTHNATIDNATDIRAEGSTLLITVPQATEAMLTDLSGRLIRTLSLAPGQTRIEGLRPALYIVKLPKREGVKVLL